MISNKCQQCGLVNFPGATACRRCNTPVSGSAEGDAAPVGGSLQATLNPDSYNYSQPNDTASFSAEASLPFAGAFVSPYAQAPKLRTGHATASLVLGIFGVFSAGLIGLGSLIGLGLGIRAALKARNEPNVYGAKGIAIGGIVTNSLGLLSIVPIAIFAAILIPNIMRARIAANESSAMSHIHGIGAAEAIFQSTVGLGENFGDMQDLIDEGLVPPDSAHYFGYDFRIRVRASSSPENGGLAPGFEIAAVPSNYGLSGRMSFYMSEVYVILCADKQGKEATSDDDPADEYFEGFMGSFTRKPSRDDGGRRRPRSQGD